MPRIFISYRRADSRKDAGRLHDRLAQAFGAKNVFKDVDDIPPGRDFRGVIAEAVDWCDILLVVIGRRWLDIQDEHGTRRLDDPDDFVRIEIEAGLRRDYCLVIPVLVDNAEMPPAGELPDSLRELSYLNAVTIRDDPDFNRDASRLIVQLKRYFSSAKKRSKNTRVIGATGALLLVAVVIAGLVLLNNNGGNGSTKTPGENTSVAQQPTDTPVLTPSLTTTETPTETLTPSLTPSLTPTETPTLSATELEQTVEAEMNLALTENAQTAAVEEAAMAAVLTATGQAIGFQATQEADDLTATATLWTATPTPDLRATAHARLTETQAVLIAQATANSNETATQWPLDQTATADVWTDTPTPTFTPTVTPSHTPTPTPEPTLTPTVPKEPLPVIDESGQVLIHQTTATDIGEALRLRIYFSVVDDLEQVMLSPEIQGARVILDDGTDLYALVEQSREPLYVALVLDASGSMGSAAEDMRQAAIQAVVDAPVETQFAIIRFNENTDLLQDFTGDRNRAINAIGEVQPVNQAGTCLYDAAYTAIDILNKSSSVRRSVVLFTDGRDEQLSGEKCSSHTFDEVVRFANRLSPRVPIYTIGLSTAQQNINVAELQSMASQTGGISVTGEQRSLSGLFKQITEAFNNQQETEVFVYPAQGQHLTTLYVYSANGRAYRPGQILFEATRDFVFSGQTLTTPEPTVTLDPYVITWTPLPPTVTLNATVVTWTPSPTFTPTPTLSSAEQMLVWADQEGIMLSEETTLYQLYRASDTEPYTVLQMIPLQPGTQVRLLSDVQQPHPTMSTLTLREVEVLDGSNRGIWGWVDQTALEKAQPIAPRVTTTDERGVNVRAGDSVVFGVIGSLAPGEYALVLGISSRNSVWYHVQLPDGTTGWLPSSTVVVVGDVSDLPLVVPPPTPAP